MPMTPLFFGQSTLVTAIGRGKPATLTALRKRQSGLQPCNFQGHILPTYMGMVEGLEEVGLPSDLAHFHCRNNQLALLGLQQDDFENHVAEPADTTEPIESPYSLARAPLESWRQNWLINKKIPLRAGFRPTLSHEAGIRKMRFPSPILFVNIYSSPARLRSFLLPVHRARKSLRRHPGISKPDSARPSLSAGWIVSASPRCTGFQPCN